MSDQRLPLDASGKKCWAMKDFTFHGKRYRRGDRFNWRQLSCSARQAQRLWDNRFITSGDVELKDEPEAPKKRKARSAAPASETTQEQATDAPAEPPTGEDAEA